MIERRFQNIPAGNIEKVDQQSFLISLGWSRGTTWEDLLRSKRMLVISELALARRMNAANGRGVFGMPANQHSSVN